jgi:uncharacterized DUF497 family protein
MEFEWDEQKSRRNLIERGLPFELAIELFAAPTLEKADLRRDYGESRTRAIGVVGGRILHCVYTDRENVRRIISLRYANRRERNGYRATFPD